MYNSQYCTNLNICKKLRLLRRGGSQIFNMHLHLADTKYFIHNITLFITPKINGENNYPFPHPISQMNVNRFRELNLLLKIMQLEENGAGIFIWVQISLKYIIFYYSTLLLQMKYTPIEK